MYFLISYYGQESTLLANRIKQICKELIPLIKVNTCFKKALTLKNIFLPIQKGLDETKKNKKLVYKISCLDCDKCYVGETSREKTTRIKEHEAYVKNFT